MFTDAWVQRGRSLLAHGPASVRSLGLRFHPGIPSRLVTAFTRTSMIRRAVRDMMLRPRGDEAIYRWDLEYGAWFDRTVRRHLERMPLDPGTDAFFGFMTGSLQSLEFMASIGVPTIVDQPSAGRTELEIVAREMDRWPGWIDHTSHVPEAFWEMVSAEWHAANLVLVNSQWSRTALIQQGVAADRIAVVPCVFEPNAALTLKRGVRNSQLNVLFLGRVTLGKGIQYLLESARLLRGHSVRFVVVGSPMISDHAVRSAPDNVHFVGRVSRAETARHYADSDVFAFPTLCDGFGMTQLEAMAHGLPVIATSNCGDVVTHGEDGLIVPAADAEALAAAIAALADDRQRLQAMSIRALEKSQQFTLQRYADAVNDAFPAAIRTDIGAPHQRARHQKST
jgi:glycosyltransferase involved in cell wall biosynthesis